MLFFGLFSLLPPPGKYSARALVRSVTIVVVLLLSFNQPALLALES